MPGEAQESIEAVPVEPVEAQELAPPPPREFSGTAIAIDSSTIRVGGETLTLYGLAPIRADWRAEAAARAALDDLVRDIEIHCTEAGRDRYRRLLAFSASRRISRLSMTAKIPRAICSFGPARACSTFPWRSMISTLFSNECMASGPLST